VLADLIQLLNQMGPMGPSGMFVGFLIWDRIQQNKAHQDREAQTQAITKERIQAETEMAKSLTLLAERINHVR